MDTRKPQPPAVVAWIKPLLAILLAMGVALLVTTPMVKMQPKDMPIAVVNLDQGTSTPQGEVNAGKQLVEQLTATTMDGAVAWVLLDSQAQVDQALQDNDVYASFVVPADFTTTSAAAQQGSGEANPVVLTVNQGKNPMAATQLTTAFSALTASGMPVTQTVFHPVPASLGMVAIFLPMLFVLMAFISSMVGGVVTRASFPLGASHRWKTIACQAVVAVMGAAVVGLGATTLLNSMAGAGLPVLDSALFVGVAVLALMAIAIGSVNWFGTPGLAIPGLMFVLSMSTATLAYEFLPAFWQNLVYPWSPIRLLGDGVRALLFQDATWWNTATPGLLVTALIGLALMASSAYRPRKAVTIDA